MKLSLDFEYSANSVTKCQKWRHRNKHEYASLSGLTPEIFRSFLRSSITFILFHQTVVAKKIQTHTHTYTHMYIHK